jgi:hypothetical protein
MGTLADLLLLSPAGLAAGLAALLAPLLVHLISRSRGKRVLVGDLELVRAARRRRLSEPRITEWPLLLLRLLLVAVAALVLGQAALPGQERLDRDAVYLTPAWLASAPAEERTQVLSRRDAELRVLAPGFPAPADYPAHAAAEDAWPLLAERLSRVRHGGEVEVYALGQLREFGPRRPQLPRPVSWRITGPAADPAATPRPAPPPVTVITEPGIALATPVLRALELLRQHRWPELDWTVVDGAAAPPEGRGGVSLWLTASPPADPDTAVAGRERRLWLNQEPWTSLGAELPERLLDVLLDAPLRAAAFADAPVSPGESAVDTPIDPAMLPARELQPWLAMALILLWGLERWLSERRRPSRG